MEPSCRFGRLEALTEVVVAGVYNEETRHVKKTQDVMDIKDEKKDSLLDENISELEQDGRNIPSSSCNTEFNGVFDKMMLMTFWNSFKRLFSFTWTSGTSEPARNERGDSNKCVEDPSQLFIEEGNKDLQYKCVFRVHPLDMPIVLPDNFSDSILCQTYTVFVHKKNIACLNLNNDTNLPLICTITVLPEPKDKTNKPVSENVLPSETNSDKKLSSSTLPNKFQQSVFVQAIELESVYKEFSPKLKKHFEEIVHNDSQRCVFISDALNRMLQVKTGSKVLLQGLNQKPEVEICKIQIFSLVAEVSFIFVYSICGEKSNDLHGEMIGRHAVNQSTRFIGSSEIE